MLVERTSNGSASNGRRSGKLDPVQYRRTQRRRGRTRFSTRLRTDLIRFVARVHTRVFQEYICRKRA